MNDHDVIDVNAVIFPEDDDPPLSILEVAGELECLTDELRQDNDEAELRDALYGLISDALPTFDRHGARAIYPGKRGNFDFGEWVKMADVQRILPELLVRFLREQGRL